MTTPLPRSTSRPDAPLGIAILRVVLGVVFTAHGAQKLFVLGFMGATGLFSHLGIPAPGLTGPFIALLEFFGGLCLIAGLLTRFAALALALDMLGAILLVHLAGGFFLPTGYEFTLTLLAGLVAITLAGPGSFSLDEMFAARRAHRMTVT